MTRSRSERPLVRPLTEVFGLPFAQTDVDFVIPNLAGDVRLAIDPFLLFKSRNPEYRAAHGQLLDVFNEAIKAYAAGDVDRARRLLNFPEVNEINFGYRTTSRYGSGLGTHLNRLLLETLGESPALVVRGVRHVEEMQLVALGINADRVSDITANVLKGFLIEYTQRQAAQYGIPIQQAVPVEHVFDFSTRQWRDEYFDLPVNPIDGRAILLVPRRVVRALPWINFDEYQRLEFAAFLRAKRTASALKAGAAAARPSKEELVAVTRREVERIDHYVDLKERDARHAEPINLGVGAELRAECDSLMRELAALGPGRAPAYEYQELMFRVLNCLFAPDLIEGRKQVRTEDGTEIRDILYTNDSDKPFWDFLRNQHGALTLVFECKNTESVDLNDINQLAGYLGDPLGYVGVLVSRRPVSDDRRRKCIAWYNKGAPHRVVLHLSDDDAIRMLQMRAAGNDPTQVVRFRYQELMAKIQ